MNAQESETLLGAWPLSAKRQRCVLMNAHRMVRGRYRRVPLWSFIGEITGHGSGYSIEICKANGWDPNKDGSIPLTDA